MSSHVFKMQNASRMKYDLKVTVNGWIANFCSLADYNIDIIIAMIKMK